MKRAFISIILMILIMTFNCNYAKSQNVKINSQSSKNVSIELNINDFKDKIIEYRGQMMHEINIDEIILPMDKGIPNVPIINRFVAIPQGSRAEINIISFDKETITDIDIAPSLGYTVENQELARDYSRDEEIYSKDEMFPGQLVMAGEPTSLRGVDAVLLNICPVQFNPVRKEVEIYKNIVFSVDFKGGNGHFGDDRLRSQYWDPILANNIINYESLPVIDYEKRMQKWLRDGDEGCEYLIVVPQNQSFIAYGEKLADYRRKQGILTQVVSPSEMNVFTLEMMKEWFHNAYNNWDIPPVAVCILGDHTEDFSSGVPAMVSDHPYDGDCLTDNFYADVNDDDYPDMCFSRLVAADETELPLFVDRQIEYEFTSPNMSQDSYQSPVTCVGWDINKWFQMSLESVGGYLRSIGKTPIRINGVYSGGNFDQWSYAANATSITDYFGPNGLGYLPESPTALGNWEGGTGADVVNAINMGTSIVQQRDHGWDYKWYQPVLYTSDLDNLHNVGKLPFLISVNCRTGSFGREYSCLLESFFRRRYNGHNAGVVGAIGPTGQSYTFTNDVLMWGIWDFFYHDFLPEYGVQGPFNDCENINMMPSFALVSAKYFLAASSFPNQSDEARKYTNRMYHSHCDAFLRVFTEMPQEMEVSYNPVLIAGDENFTVNAPIGATIGLSKRVDDGHFDILASATGNGEEQTIELSESLLPGDTLFITIAGQNYLRHEAYVLAIVSEGSYLAVTDYSFNDGIDTICYGENVNLDVVIRNLGVDDSESGIVRISTHSQYITFNTDEYAIPAIAHGDSLFVENIFNFDIATNAPDGEIVKFVVEFESQGVTTTSVLKMKLMGPDFEFGNVTILDTLGQPYYSLNPGEYAKFKFKISNNGSCISEPITAYLIDNDGNMRVVTESVNVGSMEIGQQEDIVFDVYIEWSAGEECMVSYTLYLESGDYVFEKDFNTQVGLFIIDFETGQLDPTLWYHETPLTAWFISDDNPYEGNYCLKSFPITDSGSTLISMTYNTVHDGIISFYYKVSSEANYDFLKFYIDGVNKGSWSGEINWAEAEYEVNAGIHAFKWEYVKDYSMSSGEDCARIDYITFPPSYDEIVEINTEHINVFPNPSNGIFHIETIDNEDVTSIKIHDMAGRLMKRQINSNKINASNLPNGMYILEIETTKSKLYKKVMINK